MASAARAYCRIWCGELPVLAPGEAMELFTSTVGKGRNAGGVVGGGRVVCVPVVVTDIELSSGGAGVVMRRHDPPPPTCRAAPPSSRPPCLPYTSSPPTTCPRAHPPVPMASAARAYCRIGCEVLLVLVSAMILELCVPISGCAVMQWMYGISPLHPTACGGPIRSFFWFLFLRFGRRGAVSGGVCVASCLTV